ncbi:MAG: CNNM domain-containing protein [Planctomycetota bacterium]
MDATLPVLLFLLAASATFSGAEAALFTLAPDQPRSGKGVAPALLRDPSGALTVILLGNLLANLGFFAVLATATLPLPTGAAVIWSTGGLLGMILLGEILPKVVSNRFASRTAVYLLPPVWLLYCLLHPFLRRLGTRDPFRQVPPDPLDPAQADLLLEDQGEAILSREEKGLLQHLLELGHLRAGSVRRPLPETLRLAWDQPLDQACARVRAEGLAWAPVVDASGEIAAALDLTRNPRGRTAGEASLPVPLLPELAPLSAGVRLLRDSGLPFVSLVDEYGHSAGILERGCWADTLLDRLPHEPSGRLAAIVPLGGGAFQVDASLPLHVFRERFGDPGDVDVRLDTLGGLVQERLGRVPRVGDRVRLGGFYGGIDVRVIRCEGARPVELEVRTSLPNDGTPATHPRAGTE